jgi:hypothetical protein
MLPSLIEFLILDLALALCGVALIEIGLSKLWRRWRLGAAEVLTGLLTFGTSIAIAALYLF